MTIYRILTTTPPLLMLLIAGIFALSQQPAFAQVSGQAFQGFQKNNKDPIQMEADELEVIDGQKKAVFTGRVKVRQGTSTITAAKLTALYLGDAKGDGGNGIDRLIFEGNVVVTSGENTATADEGVYNAKQETVTLSGNVVISQGQNAAKGCKLHANLRTNVAKLDSCGGRVKTIFTPGTTAGAPKN